MKWGGKWDNCNSIINKYIKKKKKKRLEQASCLVFDYRRKESRLLPLSMMLAVGFCTCPLSSGGDSLLFLFIECLYDERMLGFVKCFLCLLR